jgi:iron(III) transport system permease protein
VYGCIFLIPAILAFVVDLLNKESANSSFVTKPFENNDNKLKKVIAYVFSLVVSAIIVFFIFSFIIMGFAKSYPNNLTFTLDNIAKTFKLRAGRYLLNSIVIALLVSVLGVVIAFFTAYMTARMKTKTSKFLHLSSITSAAVPGLVLGLSYLLVFRRSSLNGTIIILVLVNMVHFISSPYLMMYNTFSKLNDNLEAVGHTLGISRAHMIKDVFVPTCKGTLMEMFSYFFVNCMMTISAVSFLYYPTNKPISLMINQFEAQMQYECAAIVSLIILGINLIVKGTIHIIKTKRKKQVI